jgi:protein-tyrosine kinase
LSVDAPQAVEVRALIEPSSALRPHFEELAHNLLAARGGPRTVVVTSPEPGAGCTSVCLGLGAALAGRGHPTALVDCNLEDPQLHRMLGESNFVGLTSGMENGKTLERYGKEVAPGLLVVPTGPVPADPATRRESKRFLRAVQGLTESRKIVLLDAPVAEEVLASRSLSQGFDGVLLVVHATRTPKSVARSVTDDLLGAGINLLGVVLNGQRATRSAEGAG